MLRSLTLDRPEQLHEIRAQWDELATLSSNPYCAPAWMLAWWRHVAPQGARLRVHATFDDDVLVGLAPFFVDRGFGGIARYRLLCAGTSAPLDLLARPSHESAVAREIARFLSAASPRADAIMLEGLRAASRWPELIREAWPAASLPAVAPQFSQPAPFVELRGRTHAQWLATRSSHFRRKMRREQEAIESIGAEIRVSTSAAELARDLDDFVRLHHRRWRSRGGSGVLDARVERMVRDAGAELVEQGRFRLWSMRLDGRAISSQLMVSAGGETAYWLGGFDDQAQRIRRPGIITLLRALEHAFAAGDTRLDLGPGAQSYKREVSETESSLVWTVLVPRGWRGALAGVQLAKPRARQLLARRLPPAAKHLVRRVLATTARLRGR